MQRWEEERENFASVEEKLEGICERAGVRIMYSCLRDLRSCFAVETREIAS